MEIDFDLGIERGAHPMQFVEQLPASIVVAWIEPLNDMDAAEHETVIHTRAPSLRTCLHTEGPEVRVLVDDCGLDLLVQEVGQFVLPIE